MEGRAGAASALYSLLGHKGDLLLLHFRPSFEELLQAELGLARLPFADYLEPTTSYLSVVELCLYDSTLRLYTGLAERGIAPGSQDWERELQETLERQRAAMAPRLYPAIPPGRHICFYPMNRKRDASANWYRLAMAKRRDLMREHGETGRKYAGLVKQIVSGSIGFDDWEWGVDLFADDPVVFKKLIYEMRFDEATALYAEFGPFYVGVRLPAGRLQSFLSGTAG
jgi:chlorite dismutase